MTELKPCPFCHTPIPYVKCFYCKGSGKERHYDMEDGFVEGACSICGGKGMIPEFKADLYNKMVDESQDVLALGFGEG